MLEYISLALLIVMVTFVIYLVIYIHDIPYEIAKKRNHPHQDAIHIAGSLSLFLLHTIWPFLWIWAYLYKPGEIMAQGQLLPDDNLIKLEGVTKPGRVLVEFDVKDDLSSYQLPVGVKAYIAVYSDTWKPVAIIRKVLLRIMSWENYLFSFMA